MPRVGQPISQSVAAPTVQSRAATLEAELAALRQLESAIATVRTLKRKFPKLVEEFSKQLHAAIDDEPSELEPQIAPANESETEYEYGVEKLVTWFRSRNNEPASVSQMAAAISRSEKTIKSIIYTRHKGMFVPIETRGRNNRAFYRMAEAQ